MLLVQASAKGTRDVTETRTSNAVILFSHSHDEREVVMDLFEFPETDQAVRVAAFVCREAHTAN